MVSQMHPLLDFNRALDQPRYLVLIGGGGHAKVVADAAASVGWSIIGFLDDSPDAPLRRLGIPHLGSLAGWDQIDSHAHFMPAIGDNQIRRASTLPIWERCPERLAVVVHPTAQVSSLDVSLAQGAFIGPGAMINPSTKIGIAVIINTRAIIEHDCQIESFSHVGPDATLGGGVMVGEGALVGLGCRIRPRQSVGARAVVGAGSVVVEDVSTGATVCGTPARTIRQASAA